ncbi:MAG: tRNA pseudouridine(55) synthase TruB [Deltaproteobacteria bacterium]|nr:tRNA pseudouridine(55) synthase TruB [Deltaproteobacteria bacterium]
MNGVLVIDKPAGFTSHDAVAVVKKKLGAKKVGHLGTLDPLATGVLVLVIDGATKYARYLDNGKKEYLSTLKLGEETDTYDSEGRVLASCDPSSVKEEDIEKAFSSFRGSIRQVPPMYSSIKKNGVPLYKLARKGIMVEREPREVEIISIEVTKIFMPYVEFKTVCSKGTYIRSICFDAGRLIGCGAHMTGLRRTACGEFTIREAVSPEEEAESLRSRIIPLNEALKRESADIIIPEASAAVS